MPHIQGHFTTQIEQQIPARFADYMSAVQLINLDRRQTLAFREKGHEEMNPLLGRTPSPTRVNFMTSLAMAFPLMLEKMDIPNTLKSSIAKSVAMTERMVTDQNEVKSSGKLFAANIPFGAVFSYRGDFERPLEKLLRQWTDNNK